MILNKIYGIILTTLINKYIKMDLKFLQSNRFWAGVVGSASAVLVAPSFVTNPWYVSLGKFLGLLATVFISVRTLDRLGEKMGNETGK